MFFKKFCTGSIIELMKNLGGLLDQSSLNTLTFRFTDHYQEGHYAKLPAELRIPKKGNIKNNDQKCFFTVSC